jgi:hypothetical protein
VVAAVTAADAEVRPAGTRIAVTFADLVARRAADRATV